MSERDPLQLVGELLEGHYRVEELVGEGELTFLYRGRDEGVNAPVAIKVLDVPETLDDALVAPLATAFREGARLDYRLARGHLHIVRTLAVGDTVAPRTGRRLTYAAREWLEGRTLSAELRERTRAKLGPRTPPQAVALLESAADALAFAHAEGFAHHALSPRSLFLAKTRRGEVLKVLDFAAGKPLGSPALAEGLRLMRSSYAAPEQLDRRFGAPCAATDVYAFALVLYEILVGKPYFPPNAHASEILRVAAAPPSLSGKAPPNEIGRALARALAPHAGARPENMGAFWRDLRRAVERASPPESKRVAVRKPSKPPPLPPAARCSRTWEGGAVLSTPPRQLVHAPAPAGADVDDGAPTLALPRLCLDAPASAPPTKEDRSKARARARRRWLALAMIALVVAIAALASEAARAGSRASQGGREERTSVPEPRSDVAATTDARGSR